MIVITEQQQKQAREFRRRVKAVLASNDDTMTALSKRIGYKLSIVSSALRHGTWPHVIAAIKADLFGEKEGVINSDALSFVANSGTNVEGGAL